MPEHDNAVNSYFLLGYGESEKYMYPAYFVVDELQTGLAEVRYFDLLYSAQTRKIEGSAYNSQGFQAPLPSKISIEELLEIVNEEYSDILSEFLTFCLSYTIRHFQSIV